MKSQFQSLKNKLRYTENTKARKRRICAFITGVDTSSSKSAKLNMEGTSETLSEAKQEDAGDGPDRHVRFDGSMTTPPTSSTTAIRSTKTAILSQTAFPGMESSTLTKTGNSTEKEGPIVYNINLSGAANFNLHFG